MISDTMAFFWLIGLVASFLAVFIPGFYLSFLFLKARKLSTIVAFLLSCFIGSFLGFNFQDPIFSFFGSLKFIHEALPIVALTSSFILEIITIIILIRKQPKIKEADQNKIK